MASLLLVYVHARSVAVAAVGRRAYAKTGAPRRARRRLAWDHQLRLRLFWLTAFFLALGAWTELRFFVLLKVTAPHR